MERGRGEKKWEEKGGSARALSTSIRGAGERRENVGAGDSRLAACGSAESGEGGGGLEGKELTSGPRLSAREREGGGGGRLGHGLGGGRERGGIWAERLKGRERGKGFCHFLFQTKFSTHFPIEFLIQLTFCF